MRLQKKANLEKSLAFENNKENLEVTVMSKSGQKYSVPKSHVHEVTPEFLEQIEKNDRDYEEGKIKPIPREWIDE